MNLSVTGGFPRWTRGFRTTFARRLDEFMSAP
jgi:hypothetical protein